MTGDLWRYVVSRVALRHCSARICESIRDLCFFVPALTANLDPPNTSSRLSFNASRSADLAVFAVGHDREIGVDRVLDVQEVALERAVGADHRAPTFEGRERGAVATG